MVVCLPKRSPSKDPCGEGSSTDHLASLLHVALKCGAHHSRVSASVSSGCCRWVLSCIWATTFWREDFNFEKAFSKEYEQPSSSEDLLCRQDSHKIFS